MLVAALVARPGVNHAVRAWATRPRLFLMAAPESPVIHRPVMYQDWRDLTFLHWRYPADVVQKLLPPALTVQTFDGDAWIGLVPFPHGPVRAPGVPALPGLSRFPETNVRTYVTGRRLRGHLLLLARRRPAAGRVTGRWNYPPAVRVVAHSVAASPGRFR